MSEYYYVSFKYSESVFCTNLCKAQSEDDVKKTMAIMNGIQSDLQKQAKCLMHREKECQLQLHKS